MKKANYLLRSLSHYLTPKICPYCKHKEATVVDKKFVVTTLNECQHCRLLFRHPSDSTAFNRKFYQKAYTQADGITTDLPSDDQLKEMLRRNFEGSGKDYRHKIALVKALATGNRILDYGANWGYTSYQFLQEGFAVQSYEISKPRAAYGDKLGIPILTDEDQIKGPVDVFFSSHVIEHVPDIRHMFRLAQRLLTAEGLFIAYCPNGSAALRTANPALFHRFWGQVHPNLLSAEFFATVFKDVPHLIGSEAAEHPVDWDGQSRRVLDVSGNELFVVAKIKGQTF